MKSDRKVSTERAKKTLFTKNIILKSVVLLITLVVIGAAILGNVANAMNPSNLWTVLQEKINTTPSPVTKPVIEDNFPFFRFPSPNTQVLPSTPPPSPEDKNQRTCYKPDGSWFYTYSYCDDFKWDSSSKLVGTVTSTVTPKPVVAKRVAKPATNADPPVHCQILDRCGGGSKPLKKSECDNMTCCIYSDGMAKFITKQECMGTSTVNSPTKSTQQPYNPNTTYQCTIGTQTYYFTPSECSRKLTEYWSNQRQNITTNQTPLPTYIPHTPPEAIPTQANCGSVLAECRRVYSEKIQAANAQFGGASSAGEAAKEILAQEFESCSAGCN